VVGVISKLTENGSKFHDNTRGNAHSPVIKEQRGMPSLNSVLPENNRPVSGRALESQRKRTSDISMRTGAAFQMHEESKRVHQSNRTERNVAERMNRTAQCVSASSSNMRSTLHAALGMRSVDVAFLTLGSIDIRATASRVS
jgi:hypothetical protein